MSNYPNSLAELLLRRDLGTDVGGSLDLHAKVDALDTDLSTVLTNQANIETDTQDLQATLANGTYGLAALKALIDAIQSTANAIEVDTQAIEIDTQDLQATLANGVYGLAALKTLIDAIQTTANAIEIDTTAIEIDTQDIQATLANASYGLSALLAKLVDMEVTIDAIEVDTIAIEADTQDIQATLANATYGLSALRTLLLTLQTTADNIEADTQDIQASLANGTYGLAALDTDLANIEVDTQDIQSTLGTPAGASVSADIAALKAVADTINLNTDTLESLIGSPANVTVSADIAEVVSLVSGIQNNTRTTVAILPEMEIPATGNRYFKIILSNYDSAGNMQVPDSAPLVTAESFGGVSRSANLFQDGDGTDTALVASAMVLDTPGVYYVFYKVADSHPANEGLVFEFSVTESAVTRTMTRVSRTVEDISSTFTASDRVTLNNISGYVDTLETVIGTPAGASVSADIAALQAAIDVIDGIVDTINTNTDSIETDLGLIKNKNGSLTFNQATDSLEALSEKIDALTAGASKVPMFRAFKTSGAIAQGGSEVITLTSTEGIPSLNFQIIEVRAIPTASTSTNFTIEIFEESTPSLPLFKWERANSTKGDFRGSVNLLFFNRESVPVEEIYVRITNVTDPSGPSTFDIEIRGIEGLA